MIATITQEDIDASIAQRLADPGYKPTKHCPISRRLSADLGAPVETSATSATIDGRPVRRFKLEGVGNWQFRFDSGHSVKPIEITYTEWSA